VRLGEFGTTVGFCLLTGLGLCWGRKWVVKLAALGLVLALLFVIFNVLFGLRTPQIAICDGDIAYICMESRPCAASPVKTWEAFLFSLSLCLLLVILAPLTSLCLYTPHFTWKPTISASPNPALTKTEETDQSFTVLGYSAFDASGEVLTMEQAKATGATKGEPLAVMIQVPKKDFEIAGSSQGRISVVFKKKGKK